MASLTVHLHKRYFFDVTLTPKVVVASISQGNVAFSSTRPLSPMIAVRGPTPSILVVKVDWGKVANVASIAAAPFTGGSSLALNAGLRAGAVGVQGLRAAQAGRKAAQAGKGLTAARGTQQAALANKPNKVSVRRGSGATTQAAKRKTDAAVRSGQQTQLPGMETVDPTNVGEGRAQGFEAVHERAQEAPQPSVEMPQDMPQETFSAGGQQGTYDARQQLDTAQGHADEMDAQHGKMKDEYDKEWANQSSPMAMAATGAVGVNQMQGRSQANQAKQQAEMERIEGIAEAGRTKSATGGGQVAVTP